MLSVMPDSLDEGGLCISLPVILFPIAMLECALLHVADLTIPKK